MKAKIEIPDELYRRVQEKIALEGRVMREIIEELFRGYLDGFEEGSRRAAREKVNRQESRLLDGEPLPTWFGMLEKYAHQVKQNDMESIRQSVAGGITAERKL
jgi:hypothetical protein